MRKIREILRLKGETHRTHREIAQACGVGASTVGRYWAAAQAAGLDWPLPDGLDDADLERLLFPPPPVGVERPLPDLAEVHQELRRKHVTLQLLWHEYHEAHPSGYSYSQYCELYRRWKGKLSPSMRQHHRAGEKAFVDFAGTTPQLRDRRTGGCVDVELFVGVLGASSYTYAEATADQQLGSWIGAHERMLHYFDGSPEILVPDNLRSGVDAPCRYDPDINRTYAEFAGHHGAVVIPARVRRPKDKAKVESGVLLAERWILAVLRHRTFFSLGELNQAIREQLKRLNDRPMKRLGVSRRELFDRLDRPALKPLPAHRYELAEWLKCRPNIDYHVEVDHNYYSVPHQLARKQVEVRLTVSTIEVFFKANRVASHPRLRGQRGQHLTRPEHMPSSHRAHAEWTPSRLIAWADNSGPATSRLVASIMDSRPHPEQGFRACLGIMRLGKSYGPSRLEAACARALKLGSYRYKTVRNMLRNGMDRAPLDDVPRPDRPRTNHDNVRGAEYYAAKEDDKC